MDNNLTSKEYKSPKRILATIVYSNDHRFDMAEQESPLMRKNKVAVDKERMDEKIKVFFLIKALYY